MSCCYKLDVQYVPPNDQVVDVVTKFLPKLHFDKL